MLDKVLNLKISRQLRTIYDYPGQPIPGLEKAVGSDWSSHIPNHVVQTWEENLFGRRHKKSLLEFRKLNPDLHFRLFTRIERDEFMRNFHIDAIRSIYFESKYAPLRVDLFRYSYLFSQGGFYFDISMALRVPIKSLVHHDSSAVITQEGNFSIFMPPPIAFKKLSDPLKLFAIWGFGFVPGHQILSDTLSLIVNSIESFRGRPFDRPKEGIISFSGPAAFTTSVWKYLATNNDPSLQVYEMDFGGAGFRLPGAGYRHLKYPSYARARNDSLFD